jgi:DUF1680 family protein
MTAWTTHEGRQAIATAIARRQRERSAAWRDKLARAAAPELARALADPDILDALTARDRDALAERLNTAAPVSRPKRRAAGARRGTKLQRALARRDVRNWLIAAALTVLGLTVLTL